MESHALRPSIAPYEGAEGFCPIAAGAGARPLDLRTLREGEGCSLESRKSVLAQDAVCSLRESAVQ